jgi:ribosomal protein S18 acetylase RimI-like enzyme
MEQGSMASSPTIRLANDGDAAALTHLIHAMMTHYWGADTPDRAAVAHHVTRDILPSGCEALLAERDGEAIAIATFAVLYPGPGLGGQLTMKDLFVVDEARGSGIGQALLRHLARLAVERGCLRLDWTAELDNPRALAFYDRLGARRVTEKVYYRVDGDALKAWAEPS